MKRPILVAWLLVSAAVTPSEAQHKIELFSDREASSCGLSDTGPLLTPKYVYIFHTGPDGATGSAFAARRPECWNAYYAGDEIPYVHVGYSDNDLQIAYPECLQPPIYVGRILFYSDGSDASCCEYPVTASPTYGTIVTVDCNLDVHPATAGSQVVINPTEACPECDVPPIPPDEGDKIELFADEAGTSCALIDITPGVKSIYMFHTGPAGRTGARFAAVRPWCWDGATWLADYINAPFTHTGNSQTDLSVSYGSCLEGPIYIGRIDYSTAGTAPFCCPYPASSSETGRIEVTNCNSEVLLGSPGAEVAIKRNANANCSTCSGPPPQEAPDKIELWADAAKSTCTLVDDAPAIRSVYLFHTGPEGRRGAQVFSAPKPDCWVGAFFLGDHITPPFGFAGGSQYRLDVGYGSCIDPPILIGRIDFYATGDGLPCCSYRPQSAYPIPELRILVIDCDNVFFTASAGTGVTINPNDSCPECIEPPLKVEQTTWGRIKAMYR